MFISSLLIRKKISSSSTQLMKNKSFPKRNFFDFSIVQPIQDALYGIKTFAGIPWWTSFAVSTVFVRAALFPLMIVRLRIGPKIQKASLDIGFLSFLYRQKLKGLSKENVAERLKALKAFVTGAKASLVFNEVSFLKLFWYPVINAACFMTFLFSLRDMINKEKYADLEKGGILWFKDLTSKDSTFGLPLIALTTSYLTIELATKSTAGRILLLIKDGLQCILLMSFPLVSELPSGIFCYWIPSSFAAMAQIVLLRNNSVLNFFKVPIPRKIVPTSK